MLDEPLEVRRKVGYLPENVPLYPEMRVTSTCAIAPSSRTCRGRARRRAIGEVIARCQLGEVEKRIIGQLSRGFRQRVGLAEAMVHDPDILILDEPTSGLDPIQIREVRDLIRELAERHTILLSTHILSEVEAVCGRVIIIARGRIALDDQLAHPRRQGRSSSRPAVRPSRSGRSLQTIPGVRARRSRCRDEGIVGFEVQTRGGEDLREAMSQQAGCATAGRCGSSTSGEARSRSGSSQAVTQGQPSPTSSPRRLTMRHVPTLLARELAAYFLGPMAYLVLLAFQLIAVLNFWELVDTLSQPQRELSSLRDPMNTYISGSPAFWIAILVAIPLLTMRLFAEERRPGTIEALLTVPVTETEIVVAKWLAGVVMYCVLLVPFAIYLPFLYFQAKFDFDLGRSWAWPSA